MAEKAVAMLIKSNTDDNGDGGSVVIPATIEIRESTGPVPK
jgi:DNA-binding LacI/PurR family transcriptional regulator